MKKTILALSCFFTLLLSANAQIVITEIMYNPPESGVDSLEYIEVLNTSTGAVNMTDWTLEFGTFSFTVPALNLGAGQYQLFSVNAAAIQNNFGKASIQWATGALSNNGTSIRLKNTGGTLVDSLTFDDAAPWSTEPDGNGPSLVLCDPNSDNTLPDSWKAASTGTGVFVGGIEVRGTPGTGGGCASTLNTKTDYYTVLPGQTTALNVLSNDDIPNPANITVDIVDDPASGSATVNPDNTIQYEPDNGFCGSDGFIYQVCDGITCDTAFVGITVPCYPARSIAQMTTEDANGLADSVDVSCELTGFVYGINTRASTTGAQFTLIDGSNSAGINVFSPTDDFGYTVKEGDQIKVKGYIDQFNGLTEIIAQGITLVSGGNTLSAAPTVIAPDESTESRLIQVKNLHFVDAAEWLTGQGSGFNVRAVSDLNPNDTIVIRIDNDVDLFNLPAPPQPFDLTGLGGQFDSSNPFTSGYQISPRYKEDISTLSGVVEADFSAYVSLTPNPAGERILLQTEIAFDRVRLFSAAGVLAVTLENPAQSVQIPLGQFPAGVYFVRFEKDNAVWTTRFVKQ